MEKDAFVRPRHIAEWLNIDVQTVYKDIYSGVLPATRFKDKTILIRREDAEAWINRHSQPITTPSKRTMASSTPAT